MLDGETIKVGGEDRVLPPLNWKACKKWFKAISEGKSYDPEIMSGMLHSALVRNYPELTEDQMDEALTPTEMLTAIPVLLKLSGFTSGETLGGSKKSRIGTH